MSEKDVRETLRVLYEEFYVKEVGFDDHTAEAVYGVLDTDPDAVAMLCHAREELQGCEEVIAEADRVGGHILAWVQEAAVWSALIAWAEGKFHVRLTDKGYEWAEEGKE